MKAHTAPARQPRTAWGLLAGAEPAAQLMEHFIAERMIETTINYGILVWLLADTDYQNE